MAEQTESNARSRRRWLIIGVIAAGVVLLAAFMSMGRKDVPIRVDRAVRGDIRSAISTNGKIEPLNAFEAHAPAPATVRRVLVNEGDKVAAGQLLVELDAADARAQAAKAQAQLRAAEADLHAVESGGTHEEVLTTQSQASKAQTEVENAQRNLDALVRLQQKGAASAAEVEAARARLNTAEADQKLAQGRLTSRFAPQDMARAQANANEARAALAAAQDLLAHSEIRAPREGTVFALPLHAGQFVNTGDLLVQVADLSEVQVRAFVDEPEIARLHPGQEVQITWDAMPGRVWTGSLSRVPTSVVTIGSRNVGQLTCAVNNGDRKLLPNVNVNVNIITADVKNALTVPREAVHQENNQHFVYHVEGNRLKRHDVQIGIMNLTRIEVAQGLEDNAVVALGAINGRPLQDGMAVRITNP